MLMICQEFEGLSKIEGFVFAFLLIQTACFWIMFLIYTIRRLLKEHYLSGCLYFPLNFIIDNNTAVV